MGLAKCCVSFFYVLAMASSAWALPAGSCEHLFSSQDTSTFIGGRLLEIRQPPQTSLSSQPYTITSLKVAEDAGGTALEMMVRLPDGGRFNLLGTGNAANVEQRYDAMADSGDPYANNSFTWSNTSATLFPLANRLMGDVVAPGMIAASVLGQTVRVPLNHGHGPGQKEHHIHGFAFNRPTMVERSIDGRGAHLTVKFPPGFYGDAWVGRASLTTRHTLVDGGYRFELEARNVGDTPIPFGAGAHPISSRPVVVPRP